jgi:hypothetical protein
MSDNGCTLRFLRAALVLAGCLAGTVAWADPPGRVGRLSGMEGDVSLNDGDGGDWQAVSPNWPVTGGDTLWSGPGSRADLRVGSAVLRLDGSTELQILRLDDEAIDVRLLRGSIALRLDDPALARQFRFESEHGHSALIEPGRYRFDFSDFTTTATVYRGQLAFEGSGQAYVVAPGQRAEFWYTGSLEMRLSDVRHDDFFDWIMACDRREDRWRVPRYVSAAMTGYEDLELYGDWRASEEYGELWTPRLVPIGWTPYRHGRWALIAPWGWTWIDEAPWGFAPFHYGRWVFWRGSWAWVPGHYDPSPVYAPALVAWIGQPGTSPLMLGGAAAVGWFPLGPREAYYPAYRSSDRYLGRLNIPHGVSPGSGAAGAAAEPIHYLNRHLPQAVTAVPVAVMTGGRPVSKSFDGRIDLRAIADLPVSRDAPLHLRVPPREEHHDRQADARFRAAEPPVPAVPMHGGQHQPFSVAPAPPMPQALHAAPGKDSAAENAHPRHLRGDEGKTPALAATQGKPPRGQSKPAAQPQEHHREAVKPAAAAPPPQPQHQGSAEARHGKEVGAERHRDAPAKRDKD